MSNQEFINQIISQYNLAKKLTTDGYEGKIERGKKRSISGVAEDLFAVWLFNNLKDDSLKLLVDKPVSFDFLNGIKKSKTIQPDILILRNDVIVGCIDIKMDLGWKKDFELYIKGKDILMKEIRGKKCRTNYYNGEKKYSRHHSFSTNLSYQIVVLSGKNKTDKKINEIKSISDYSNVNTYVLTRKQHLNVSEKSKKLENVRLIDDQFEAILKDLKMQLANDFKGC